jgi:hypothetical protein
MTGIAANLTQPPRPIYEGLAKLAIFEPGRCGEHRHGPDTLLVVLPLSRQEDPCMSDTERQFTGIRGFLCLAVGFLLLAAAAGSAIYIIVNLLNYL